jgi:preprotein translocase subunit SecD
MMTPSWGALLLVLLTVCAGCMSSDGPATTEYRFEVRKQPNVSSAGGAEDAAQVLEERLDGVDGTSARAEGSTQIVVTLPKKQARSLLPVVTEPGRLEIYDVSKNLLPPSVDAQGFPVPTASRAKLEPVPEDAVVLSCGVKQRYCLGVNEAKPMRTYYYLVRHTPEMTGADLDRKQTRQDFDTNTGEPIVILKFNEAGARRFREVTRELAMRGRMFENRGNADEEVAFKQFAFKQFAMVVDGVLMAAPTIDFKETPEGIPAGKGVQISGIGSLEDARRLAAVLRGGELPVRLAVARGS